MLYLAVTTIARRPQHELQGALQFADIMAVEEALGLATTLDPVNPLPRERGGWAEHQQELSS